MSKLTPMMEQYMKIKRDHKDAILMFRMGDFYEMFFEDAKIASEILQIALTRRNKKNPDEIMCGIPYHALENYLPKLIKAGKKVALCDQTSKPDGKTIVQRRVIRVVTPGTTFDQNTLDDKTNNYLCCVYKSANEYGFAYCDVTTGDFKTSIFLNLSQLKTEILRLKPAECIYTEKTINNDSNLKKFLTSQNYIQHYPYESSLNPQNTIKEKFCINSLQIFGIEDNSPAGYASGQLYEYLLATQKTELKHIQKISYYSNSSFMSLNHACIRNLELFFTNVEQKKQGSLIWALDHTLTPMGGRKLKNWLLHPLLNKDKITLRLDMVEAFVQDSSLLRNIRLILSEVNDIERLLSRLSLGTGNARDLKTMQFSLEQIPKIKEIIGEIPIFKELVSLLDPLKHVISLIECAIRDDSPISLRDGGMIKIGYNEELDELKLISSKGKEFIQKLKEKEIARTGINNLKVKFNKVFGYYIEISNSNLKSVPQDYIRKQTLVNAERYITPELKEYEEKVLTAEERIKELEYELFYGVRMKLIEEIRAIQINAGILAKLDVLSNFAFLAEQNNYCKPDVSEGGNLIIKNGRHPVIEKISFAHDFVPNSSEFNDSQTFILLTGPNMGGKSTYLRQTALIVLMAQVGSFVSAESAEIGVVDNIFTRVGAFDNLSKGESTFMVEMEEAAYILNNATDKSLIILDEIGRGTSTYDGLSIAWAISEYIHNQIHAKTLFATHYHELTELIDTLHSARNFNVAVKEDENKNIAFLYKTLPGPASQSYGIEVAKLAGLPKSIILRSKDVLSSLEKKSLNRPVNIHDTKNAQSIQNNLFERQHKGTRLTEDIHKEIESVDIDNITPLNALAKLQELKNKLSSPQ